MTIWEIAVVLLLLTVLAQAAAAAVFLSYCRRAAPPPAEAELPAALVVLCLRGADHCLSDCLRAVFSQDYPRFRVRLMLDSRGDPAWETAAAVVRESGARHVEMRVLERPSQQCSLKCNALIQALSNLGDSTGVVALLDADVVPPRRWLRELVAPLLAPHVGAAWGNRWFAPLSSRWGSLVCWLWNTGAAVNMHLWSIPWGGSLALKTEVIRRGDLPALWSRAGCEDVPLYRVLRGLGLRSVFVPSLLLASRAEYDLSACFRFIRRQLLWVRLYRPLCWWSCAIFQFLVWGAQAAAAVLGWAAASAGRYAAAAVLGGALLANLAGLLGMVSAVSRRARPAAPAVGWFRSLSALLLTEGVTAAAFLFSLCVRRIEWRGIEYHIGGPWEIRMLEYRPAADFGRPGRDEAALEAWRMPINRALALAAAAGAAAWFWRSAWRWAGALGALWCVLYLLFRPRRSVADLSAGAPPTPWEAYRAEGLGPLPREADGRDLYLDQVKRAAAGILYEDAPFWFYDHRKRPRLAAGFSLRRRVRGEDCPSAAHTMIGVRRLENLQHCAGEALRRGVPGDFIEAGCFRGGAAIFMRAVLKAHRVRDRRVFVCDTFVPPASPRPPLVLMPLLQALTLLPGRAWRRSYLKWLQRLAGKRTAFPRMSAPADDLVRFMLWNIRNPAAFNHPEPGGLERVKANFARYGLLDDQVVFLEGFFSDTLPGAAIEKLALVRLDGDTYESTRDAIAALYPKLSPGGFLIVDDYRSFDDCRRAVDEYRAAHGIHEEIRAIDNLSVYWQKSAAGEA